MAKVDNLVSQAAALAIRNEKICLVTTRSGNGLILPKGNIPVGVHPAQLAAQEAWEEAGLIGKVIKRPFGEYTFIKSGREHCVQVFVLSVTTLSRGWPEKNFRRRAWYSLDTAIRLVSHDNLRNLLVQFIESRTSLRPTKNHRLSA